VELIQGFALAADLENVVVNRVVFGGVGSWRPRTFLLAAG